MKCLAAVLLFVSINFQIYGQEPKDVNFNERVFVSDFAGAKTGVWPEKSNQVYNFSFNDGAYQLSCNKEGRQAYLLPRDIAVLPEYMLICHLEMDRQDPGSGTVGLALNVRAGLERGYLLEVNAERQFRVTMIEGRGNYRYLTASMKQKGWRDFKKISKPGKQMKIGVLQQRNRIKVYFNDKLAYTFLNADTLVGSTGIYLNGPVKARVNDFTLHGPPGSRLKAATSAISGEDFTADNMAEGEGALGQDISTLTDAVLECRTRNQEIAEMYNSAQIHLDLCTEKKAELEEFIKNHLDVKLQKENEKLRKQAEQLRLENESLQNENNNLQEFKRQAEKGKDGDLVILLSEKLKKEQQRTADLEERLKQLEEENRKLKARRK